MKDDEIYMLFSSVAEGASEGDDNVREVFSVLIKSTLRFRDHMVEAEGTVITVDDVRSALEWLVPALKTGRLPKTDDGVMLGLLKIWLDELKKFGKLPL